MSVSHGNMSLTKEELRLLNAEYGNFSDTYQYSVRNLLGQEVTDDELKHRVETWKLHSITVVNTTHNKQG